MQYLIVASGSLTLFIIVLVLGRKERSLSNHILVVWLTVFVGNLASLFVLYETNAPFSITQNLLLEFSDVSIFAHGPLLWLYTRSLTEEGFELDRKYLWHFLPFSIGYLLFLTFIFSGSQVPLFVRNTVAIIKMGSLLAYLIIVLIKLKRHRIRVEHIFSNIEEKNLRWIAFLSWGILILWVIGGGSLLLDKWTTIQIPKYGGFISHICICVFIFLMGYFGLNQPSVFKTDSTRYTGNRKTKKSDSGKYKKSGLDTHGSKKIQKELLALMNTTKPYLVKELTLYDLADQLQVQPNHLSQVINSLEGKNFFDFINMYRVEAAKEKILLNQYQHLTLLGIAFESGFNSKASFNRAFKKTTGHTPTEFRRINELS